VRKKLVGGVATVALVATFSGKASAASHEVKPGDSLWKIANQYKTTINNIKKLNGLSSDIIYPRQVLKIDGNSNTTNKPTTSTTSKTSTQGPVTSSKAGNTYTVKSGDYLIRIANAHGITLSQLKQWNGLTSDMIRPGQVLKVSQGSSSSAPAPSTSSSPRPSANSNSGSTTTYKVVSGDTLGRIAAKYGTTVANLKQANGLRSDIIYVGQVLRLNGSAPSTGSSRNNQNSAAASVSRPTQGKVGNVVQSAKQHIGVKYAWGGTTPAGFDCSGFIYYAFKQAGHNISRLGTDGYYNRSYYTKSPQAGDLVFFKNTYRSGISHMGIYLGSNQFIHAGNNGVEVSSLNNSYWKSKFDGFKKFY